MKYQVKKPAGQRRWFVVNMATGEVKRKFNRKADALANATSWNVGYARAHFEQHGLRLVANG